MSTAQAAVALLSALAGSTETMTDETAPPPFTMKPAAVGQLETVGGAARVDLGATGCCGPTSTWTGEPPRSDQVESPGQQS